jgi:hypothetical protein
MSEPATYIFDIQKINTNINVMESRRTYKVIYKFESLSTSYTTPQVNVILEDVIPYNLETYGDILATLKDYEIDAEDQEPCLNFIITATYEFGNGNADPDDEEEETGSTSVNVTFGSADYEIVVEKAYNKDGDLVVVQNTAGDPFDPPMTERERRGVVNLTKSYSYSAWDVNYQDLLENSVNKNAIRLAGRNVPARGAWIKTISPVLTPKSKGVYYWKVTFEIEIRGNGKVYDREILNCGYNYKPEGFIDFDDDTGIATYTEPIKVKNSKTGKLETPSSPIKLDEDGAVLLDGAQPVYLKYRVKGEVNWSALHLPTTPIG